MSLNNNGDGRGRRRRKNDDYITPSIIFAAMVLALFYLYMRWRDNRITHDEIITVSVALGIAAICFICYLPAAQHWFDRMEHERKDAEQRRFWERREANERAARLKEQQAEEERAKRHAKRREEALQRQLEQSQSASVDEDQKNNSINKRS
jgi:siroheme synthase (precorrin-2 oxidase/ferrochelatase)